MSTALAIRTPRDVVSVFQRPEIVAQLTPLLGTGDTLARVAQVVQLEVLRNPDLLKCEPFSIIDSAARILSWHLELGEGAYLVPMGSKCIAMKGYKGLIQMMYDSGHVRKVVAHVVYETDRFSHSYGLTPTLEHVPATYKERGNAIGAYCIVKLRGDEPVFRYMEYEEVDAIRQAHSKQWKKGRVPDWYLLKTVIRHTSKLLPMNSQFAQLRAQLDQDDTEELGMLESIDAPEAEAVETRPALSAVPEAEVADGPDVELATEGSVLERAKRVRIPGAPDRWGGNGGKMLGEVTSGNLLRGIGSWCFDKPKYADLFAAVGVVLKWREEVGFPEREPDDEFPEPGEDEAPALFAPGAAAQRRSRNAVAEGR